MKKLKNLAFSNKTKYLTCALTGILLASVLVIAVHFAADPSVVCPEATGSLTKTQYFIEETTGAFDFVTTTATIGTDLTAVRITDLGDLNVIDKINYLPDEFVIPSLDPIEYDYQIVDLHEKTAFSKKGSLVLFILSPDAFAENFSEQSAALDKYKVGDYWRFSIMLPKVFTAANIYLDSDLIASHGEIENYEFIKYNTSDDRVTVNHVSDTERSVIELSFYTRRQALTNHVVTIHYQSDSETLSGLQDLPLIGTEKAINAVKNQYPTTFIVALVVGITALSVLIVLSFLKKTAEFISESLTLFGIFLLSLANYFLSNVTSLPVFLSALRFAALFVIIGGATDMLIKKAAPPLRIAVGALNAVGFVTTFIIPYVNLSAAAALNHLSTGIKYCALAALLILQFLPLFKKRALPDCLQAACAGVVSVAAITSSFVQPTSTVLFYPPIWLFFILTALCFAEVIRIIAITERENAYITANLNSEVERQVTDMRALIEERDNLLRFASHDLKKPLSFGRSYLNTAIERESDCEQVKLLNLVKQNTDKVLDNLTEIAAYAKFNYIAEPSRPTDLSAVCNKLYSYCADDCKAAGIMLKNTVDKKVLAFVKPQGLENALTNIILNAIEHAECTEITISIKTDKNKVLLTVKDNGKGIPDGLDVFRPYISENKPDVGGLGLYICKNIIESMNGELTYSCNGGTAFTVALLKA